MYRRTIAAASGCLAGLSLLAGCSTGPTTKSDVCSSFDLLGTEIVSGNGLFGNPVFVQAADLSDLAQRYRGSPDLGSDAAALDRIAGSRGTNSQELEDATSSIAALCGHSLGVNVVLGDGAPGALSQPTTTVHLPPPATSRPSSGYRQVSGTGGMTLSIPASWSVHAISGANREANSPSDPNELVRYGAAPPPNATLLGELQDAERMNPAFGNGYRRIRMDSTTFQGTYAVDWEFSFPKDGITRHALGRYWRSSGYGYVLYASSPESSWSSTEPVFEMMVSTVRVG